MNRFFPGIIVLCAVFFLASCAPSVYYVKPPDWTTKTKRDSTIAFYSQYFRGWKIYVDPGHGGEDRVSHGPANDVVEADLNLRVASYLRDYLQAAGATVFMSRTKDSTVQLGDRSVLANKSGADIFISVHHNAPGGNDPFVNYTSTWYHAVAGDQYYHPCNHDIAKYIQRDLAYAMGNSGASYFSFDGTLSDFIVYPNSGFSVLRRSEIPAVLLECSFFTSAYEEQRLKLEEFNEIQAWGVFRGLGKYFRAGVPRLELLSPSLDSENTATTSDYRPNVKIQAADLSGVDPASIAVEIDRKKVAFDYDTTSGIISYTPQENLSNGNHTLEVIVENRNGNSSFPFKKTLKVNPPPASIKVDVIPPIIPPDVMSVSLISALVLDELGNPVADGTRVSFSTTVGTVDPSAYTVDGRAEVYLKSSSTNNTSFISVRSGEVSQTDTVIFGVTAKCYITGIVSSSANGKPIPGVRVSPRLGASDLPEVVGLPVTRQDGRYIIWQKLGDSTTLDLRKPGFWSQEQQVSLWAATNEFNFFVNPVAKGVLFGKTYLIDPRFGGLETGEVSPDGKRSADVNLEIAQYLYRLLSASGANVYLLRDKDSTISEETRVRMTKKYRAGFYLRIDASEKDGKSSVLISRGQANQRLSRSISLMLSKSSGVDTTGIKLAEAGMFNATPLGMLALSLPSIGSGYYKPGTMRHDESRLAWGIYQGVLAYEGYEPSKTDTIRIRVEGPNGEPAGNIEVLLDNTLAAVTDSTGTATFYDVSGSSGRVEVLEKREYKASIIR
jgi:N-acetylmuramoyl-L-alanine amidase